METETKQSSGLRRFTDKLYGGLNMSWPAVILFAVAAAVITAVFLLVPIFRDTSFERMGVHLEAWIFFAVIIMANCRKPLESAVKTFVFFLISQPLIYLLQVPFSDMGWSLFGYYKYWGVVTILTFPAAFIGWYIKKKNWLSLLILLPVLGYLTMSYADGFRSAFSSFPHLIVMAVFCLLQVLVYLYSFTSNIWQKILGFAVPLAVVLAVLLSTPSIDINGSVFLPDNPVLTEEAVVVMDTDENSPAIQVSVIQTGEDSMVRVTAQEKGKVDFSIKDGDTTYLYTVEIYEDQSGHVQSEITVR